jgi:hypothetical protein
MEEKAIVADAVAGDGVNNEADVILLLFGRKKEAEEDVTRFGDGIQS